MIDYNVTETENWINRCMDEAEAACHDTAQENNISPEKANTCENGEFKCPNCPWNETER